MRKQYSGPFQAKLTWMTPALQLLELLMSTLKNACLWNMQNTPTLSSLNHNVPSPLPASWSGSNMHICTYFQFSKFLVDGKTINSKHKAVTIGFFFTDNMFRSLTLQVEEAPPAPLVVTKSDSGITRHLKTTPECRKAVGASPAKRFKVLAKARNSGHLGFLEAVYISRLSPVLCSQKEFVRSLALF